MTIVGAAAGSASLPFFSRLFAQNKMYDFNAAVNGAVSRLIAFALLTSAWMIALAIPIVSFLKGNRYTEADALATARYFTLFAVSLALWSAQGIYARAFYAARNTMVPAISGTLVTLLSIPVYGLLFHRIGIDGLAIASDLGITAHTLSLAILLHRYRLVSLATLEWSELARAALAAIASYLGVKLVLAWLPAGTGHPWNALLLAAGSSGLWLGSLHSASCSRLGRSCRGRCSGGPQPNACQAFFASSNSSFQAV